MEFNPEIANAILDRIANGESLRNIASAEGFPSRPTIYGWLSSNKEFADQYARAREEQADTYADEITAIADDPDLSSDQKRVMVDARKWVACKLKPRKYGDKVDLTHLGPNGGPVQYQQIERKIVRPAD